MLRSRVASLEAEGEDGVPSPFRSTFQVAEITRPLMSVSKICENGFTCVFTKDGAKVVDQSEKTICSFQKRNGLYVSTMKLKSPEPFTRPA